MKQYEKNGIILQYSKGNCMHNYYRIVVCEVWQIITIYSYERYGLSLQYSSMSSVDYHHNIVRKEVWTIAKILTRTVTE